MKKKFTILPRKLDEMVKQNIESKKMQNVMTIFLFITFMCLLFTFMPAFAGLGKFFGYPDSTIGIYTEILTGKSAMTTLDKVFSAEVFNAIQWMPIIKNIIKFTSLLGIAFTMLYVGLGIIEAVQHGTLTQERLAGLLITFAIPTFLIINYNIIQDSIVKLGSTTRDTIIEEVKSSDDYFKEEYIPSYEEFQLMFKGDAEAAYEKYLERVGDKGVFDRIEDLESLLSDLVTVASDASYESYLEYIATVASSARLHVCNVVYGQKIFDYKAKSLTDYWAKTANDSAKKLDAILDSDKGFLEKGWDVICNVGETAVEFITDIFSSTGDKIKEVLTGLFQKIADFILGLILVCVDIGVRLGIMLSCYGVLGRMIIYRSFLPMSIADVGREGARSNGMRMVKLYFATYLEIGMFYVVNLVGWKIFSILILQQDTIAGLIVCFIGGGTGIRALMKSAKSVSERLLGVVG